MAGPRSWRVLATLLVGGLVAACSLIKPLPKETALADRLALFPTSGLPIQGAVTIYWNDQQIPFIDAEYDQDAAFALGLVHAHLRLGQMAIYRRIAQGRIAEMGGPLATDIDHGLRILNFGRASPAIIDAMPPATRQWLERFVAGINHYQERLTELPYEYQVLGLDREPWTAADVVTFGRLAGTDVTWLVWFNLLKLRQRQDWSEIWARLVNNGSASTPSFDAATADPLGGLLAAISRSGSNSLAIAPKRSETGAAILANDPHLGLNLPNTWIIAGLKSPSYHVVGLMVPGLPLFAIGRNPRIAWGGTNMRAASSDLIDASRAAAGTIAERTETVRVRWWFDREVTVRETPWGPILSDAPQLADLELPDFALKWTGHRPSDEVTAMLAVARARNFEEFRSAFNTFAVPGQNMLYADEAGNIGQVMAVQVPKRDNHPPPDVIISPSESARSWSQLAASGDLPFSLNPERGFLASANNRPAPTDPPIGYFFSPDDRVERMASLVDRFGSLGLDDVRAIQQDVFVASSKLLNERLVAKLAAAGITETATGQERDVIALLADWDGYYRTESRGAVAFEIFRQAFTASFYQALFGDADWAAFAGVGRIKALLLEDIDRAPPAKLDPLLRESLKITAEHINDFADWGEMHRLTLRHPLAFLPIIGDRYRFADYPIGGSTDALMKTAHGATRERHSAGYGSNARHISDLSDMDRNYFVILGGQDGWLRSANFLDQVPLWLRGDHVQMPLRLEEIRKRFPHRLELSAQ
jgi:penicillin amidase